MWDGINSYLRRDEDILSETLRNKDVRRCGVVDIAEKAREPRLGFCRHKTGMKSWFHALLVDITENAKQNGCSK